MPEVSHNLKFVEATSSWGWQAGQRAPGAEGQRGNGHARLKQTVLLFPSHTYSWAAVLSDGTSLTEQKVAAFTASSGNLRAKPCTACQHALASLVDTTAQENCHPPNFAVETTQDIASTIPHML